MRFEILGPLRLIDDSQVIPIGAHKVEIVLATLLIRAGQVVSIEQFAEEIWGETPPRRATGALYVYVSQLRKLLTGSGVEDCITTQAPGYMLRADCGELDLHQFHGTFSEGRASARAGRHEQAHSAFEAALELWRGPALSDLRNGPMINSFASWAEEMHLECREMLVEVDLMLGRHRERIGFLYGLVREHPLHEKFYRQLMLALYRSERRADALNVYRLARKALKTELGLEPGHSLQKLQRAILSDSERADYQVAG